MSSEAKKSPAYPYADWAGKAPSELVCELNRLAEQLAKCEGALERANKYGAQADADLATANTAHARLSKLLETTEQQRDAAVAACRAALFDITERRKDMLERAKEYEGDNRKAQEALEYYAPDSKGRTAKQLRAVLSATPTPAPSANAELLAACKAIMAMESRMVAAGGCDGPLPDDVIESFAKSRIALLGRVEAAIALAEKGGA